MNLKNRKKIGPNCQRTNECGEFSADVDICGNTDWQGHKLGDTFRSAELQFKNTGKLTVSNCSFNATLVSPFSVEDSFTVTNCQFKNNWDTYAFKDIMAKEIEISGCQFENLGCAILIKGGTQDIQSIKITNNGFKDIDTSEWSKGAYKHGLIQFAANAEVNYAETSFTITGNSLTMTVGPEDKFGIVRAINQTVPTETILNQIITQNTFNEFPFVRYCTTLMYINPTSGDDSDDGKSSSAPVKTLNVAISKAEAPGGDDGTECRYLNLVFVGDGTIKGTIPKDKAVSLDLNGHTVSLDEDITMASGGYLAISSGTLKLAGCQVPTGVIGSTTVGSHTPVEGTAVDATCARTGLTAGKICSVCGEIIEQQQVIAKKDHTWDSGVITVEPTKTSEGVKTYTCSICGETKTESVAKLCTHVWDSGTVTEKPTCGTAGSKTFTCTKCSETKTESIAATGNHEWDSGTATGSDTIQYTCTVCKTTKVATVESEKTEVEEDGVKTTTETQKIEEESKDGTKTVTEATTVSKEENGTVVEKTETTKSTTTSTTESGSTTTVVSETTVTKKAGQATEKVGTSKSTTTTENKTTVVSETTVTEKGDQKTETIAVKIESEDKSVKTEVSVSDNTTSGINTVVTGEVTDDVIASAVKQVDMATEAISEKVTEVSKTISVDTPEVTLSPSTFGTIASSGVSLTITGDAGSIGIDSSVAVTMTSQDEDVTISINEKKDGLTDAQKQKAGENKVIELSAKTATQDIHELGGTAKVRIDMTGMEYKSPAVYWLQDDGTSVKVDAEFGEGYAAIELNHFSLYYIAETASSDTTPSFIIIPDTSDDDFPGYVPTPSSDTTDSGSKDTVRIAVLVGAIVVVLVALVALTHKSR